MIEVLMRKAGEPSTWKGLGWILVATGLIPFAAVDLLVSGGLALVGLVEIIRKEAR